MNSVDNCVTDSKVIYILGTGRSGSTILEILLSKGKDVFAAGELTSLVEDGFVKNSECSCKSLTSDCDVWSKVKDEIGLSQKEYVEWAKLQKRIDWHNGFIRQLLRKIPEDDLSRYHSINSQLYNAISNVTGSKVIIDSSKYAGRLLGIREITKQKLLVICLTRSPSGLLHSFQKKNKNEQKPKSHIGVLLYYTVSLVLLRMACFIFRKNLIEIRYEKLIENPVGTIERIEQWSKLDFSRTKTYLKEDKRFEVGHIVTGNRLRKKSEVKFKSGGNNIHLSGLKNTLVLSLMKIWQFVFRFA